MSKERNVKIYNTALDYLRSIKPQGVKLETYFIEKKRNYESLTDVYVRFIGSAQNYQAMPNIIGFYLTILPRLMSKLCKTLTMTWLHKWLNYPHRCPVKF